MAQNAYKSGESTRDVDQIKYTSNYCEENIYWLARSFSETGNLDNIFVVFISNQSKQASVPYFVEQENLATFIALFTSPPKPSPPPPLFFFLFRFLSGVNALQLDLIHWQCGITTSFSSLSLAQ
jgi:N-terminal glutamine amidase